MDVHMTNEDGTPGARIMLDHEEQIRIAALNAAIAYTKDHKVQSMAMLAKYAAAFEGFILGEDPEMAFKPPAGTTW